MDVRGQSGSCSSRTVVQEFIQLFDLGGAGVQWRSVVVDDLGRKIQGTTTKDINKEAAIARIKTYFITHTSMKHDKVIAQFWINATKVELSGHRLEDMLALSKLDVDKFAEFCHSTVPFKELAPKDRTDIKTLHRDLAIRHDGKFLLCRTLTPAVNGLWVEMVIEDPDGQHAAILRLVNFTPPKYSLNAEKYGDGCDVLELFPVGSFLAVKNVYGVMSIGPKPDVYVLQVTSHNPTDVVIISPKRMKQLFPGLVWKGVWDYCRSSFWEILSRETTLDSEIMDALKTKGNAAYALNRYTDAIRFYDLALEYVEEDCGVAFSSLWSNKAEAFIGLGCYQRALECSQKVLQRDPTHAKTVFRKVKSLIGLGRGYQVRTFLTNKLAAEPSLADNELLQYFKQKVIPRRVKMSMKKVLSMNFKDFGSEFIGPIEFRRNSPSLRGVFATKDIAAGDILLLQRTFAEIERRPISDTSDTQAFHESAKYLGHAELVGIIANKISVSPDLGRKIYTLWAGKEFPPLGEEDAQNKLVSVARIRRIVKMHARFCGQNCGDLTPKVALINHSCIDTNVIIHHSSGWCVVRAVRPIQKGSEVFTQWFNVASNIGYRLEELGKLEMTCNCRLCRRDSQDVGKVQKKFDKLCARIKAYTSADFETSRHKVDLALGIVAQLLQLRRDAPNLNTILMDRSIQTDLCDSLFHRRMYQEYVDLKEKIFVVAESVNHVLLANITAMSLVRGYLKLENMEEATIWAIEANKYASLVLGRPGLGCWPPELLAEMINARMNFTSLMM